MDNNDYIEKQEYLMNIASFMYFLCYIPEFYANWINKNSNMYNVYEKIVMVIATSFAFSYAIIINNNALIINYAPILTLDVIGLFMKIFYALRNRNIDVRIIEFMPVVENTIHELN